MTVAAALKPNRAWRHLEVVEGREELDVRAALATLARKLRQVVVEMYYYGRQVDEIARSLGVPAGTVRSRAYYALRQLKRVMSGS